MVNIVIASGTFAFNYFLLIISMRHGLHKVSRLFACGEIIG